MQRKDKKCIHVTPALIDVGKGLLPLGTLSNPDGGVVTYGPSGYITRATWGVPTASERVVESEMALKWAGWLHNPCRLGGSQCFRAGGRITSGLQKWKNLFFW